MENNDIIKIARAKAEKWLDKAYDEKTRAEAKRMLENTDTTELVESFYNDLEFGTGGLRGIMGVGTNRMNPGQEGWYHGIFIRWWFEWCLYSG